MYICVTMHANIRRIFRSGERKGLIKADGLTPKLANSAFNRGLSQKAPDGWMDGGEKGFRRNRPAVRSLLSTRRPKAYGLLCSSKCTRNSVYAREQYNG